MKSFMAGEKWLATSEIATFIKHPPRCWKSANAHFTPSVTQSGMSTSSRLKRSAGDCTGEEWRCAGSLTDAGGSRACIIHWCGPSLQILPLLAAEDERERFHALTDTGRGTARAANGLEGLFLADGGLSFGKLSTKISGDDVVRVEEP
jgi:hypothetical protein